MIDSYFDEDGQPWVWVRLTIPRLGVVNHWVLFLIDTGADITCLNPYDGRLIGCPFDELVNPAVFGGISGAHTYYIEPAIISLQEDDTAFTFEAPLSIAKPHPVVDEAPSLLGRDVLNQVRMDYDFPGGRLDLLAS